MSENVVSALPGVFYRSPSPGKEAFVQEGDTVQAGQTIGLIEIMKQFSEVLASVAGTVTEFKIDDFGTVNPGDIIAVIENS